MSCPATRWVRSPNPPCAICSDMLFGDIPHDGCANNGNCHITQRKSRCDDAAATGSDCCYNILCDCRHSIRRLHCAAAVRERMPARDGPCHFRDNTSIADLHGPAARRCVPWGFSLRGIAIRIFAPVRTSRSRAVSRAPRDSPRSLRGRWNS